MLFAEKIKQLREEWQLPQRQLAADLQIDTATYCKIERGERKAKREQITILSEIFNVKEEELTTLWFADQIMAVIAAEKKIADKALNIVKQYIIDNNEYVIDISQRRETS